jgi:hypothetical protein
MLEVVCEQPVALVKVQGSHELDIRLWDTKGLSIRPVCIRTERA